MSTSTRQTLSEPVASANSLENESESNPEEPATVTQPKRKAAAVAQENGEEEAPSKKAKGHAPPAEDANDEENQAPAPAPAKKVTAPPPAAERNDEEAQPAPVAPVKTPAKKTAATLAEKAVAAPAPAPAGEDVDMNDKEEAEAAAPAPMVKTPAKSAASPVKKPAVPQPPALESEEENHDRQQPQEITKEPDSLQNQWTALIPTRDKIMIKFHKAILETPETPEGHIVLPSGVFWPDMEESNLLFVRSFYKPCWEDVLNSGKLDGGIRKAAIVLGTSGIGKSAFGLYAMYHAIRDKRTVIYDSAKMGGAIFQDGKTFRLPPRELLAEFSDENTLYVCDGQKPKAPYGFTLLITSPEKGRWKETNKTGGTLRLVFPVHDLSEILELRKLVFDRVVSEEAAKKLFDKWGGVPRHVLTHTDSEWQQDLESLVGSFSLARLRSMVFPTDSLDSAIDQSHRVVHFTCKGQSPTSSLSPSQKEYYAFNGTVIGSQYMLEKILSAVIIKEKDSLSAFLIESAEQPLLASLRESVFERAFAIPLFISGRRAFEYKLLEYSASSVKHALCDHSILTDFLKTPHPLPLVYFDGAKTTEDLKRKWESEQGDAIFVPTAKNFPVVDFVLRVKDQPILANCTVSTKHSISKNRLKELLDAVDDRGVVPFLRVSPKDIFNDINRAMPTKFAARVAQFAVGLDVLHFPDVQKALGQSDSEEVEDPSVSENEEQEGHIATAANPSEKLKVSVHAASDSSSSEKSKEED